MKIYKKQEIDFIDEIECNICHKKYKWNEDDTFEAQEFLIIEFIGGFKSVFGDENRVTGEICQHCLKERLGDALVVKYQYESV